MKRILRCHKRAMLVAAVVASAVAMGAPAGAQAARPVHISCGDTITVDTTLANDLTNCPNDGIIIGADGITLDLNGHTVDGPGPEECSDPLCFGIDNTAGHSALTVENGSVQEFEVGVLSEGGRGHLVRGLTVSRNGDGIDLALATDSAVTGNSVDENVFGIFVGRTEDVRIARNSVIGFEGCGIEVSVSERVRVADNSVHARAPGAPRGGDSCGICVCFGSTENQIERNSVSGNGFAGVRVDPIVESFGVVADNSVTDNDIFDNTNGVILIGDRNSITRNRIVDTVANCEDCDLGVGISFDGGRRNLIANNTVERALDGPGIRFAAFEPDTPPALDNIARSNVVRSGRFDGIVVEPTAADTLLDRNTASHNGDDGIDVDSASTTLTKNTANDNHDLGIEAVPGVTDGGGNRATGNGNPLQCTNVFCSSG